jgi:hypothetical protein
MDFKAQVKKEISIGVLLGGLILSCVLWFLAYTTEQATAYSELTTADLVNQ